MTSHNCKTLNDGCYRCDLHRDEIAAFHEDIRQEAQEAWLTYRDQYTRAYYLNPRQCASRMRRREFVAGYLAANGMEVEV